METTPIATDTGNDPAVAAAVTETAATVVVATDGGAGNGMAARGYGLKPGVASVTYKGKEYTAETLTHKVARAIRQYTPWVFRKTLGREYYPVDAPYWEGALMKRSEDLQHQLRAAGTVVVDLGIAKQPCATCPK